ncbi:MAG: hypothetical protein L3J33_03365 [Rhodobacteraceae bacterium]|nr:hypothetical protein [Paracoccaceae bacterium]
MTNSKFEKSGCGTGQHVLTGCITLRDYHASNAMTAFLINEDAAYSTMKRSLDELRALGVGDITVGQVQLKCAENIAIMAHQYADAMVKERMKCVKHIRGKKQLRKKLLAV